MTEELRDKARVLGLDRLTDEHLAQFERATTGMEHHLQRLPRATTVFRATGITAPRANGLPPQRATGRACPAVAQETLEFKLLLRCSR